MDRDELKKQRWRLLPRRIKLVFWLGAFPFFTFSCVAWFVFNKPALLAMSTWLIASICYGVFEALSYNWYDKQGLLLNSVHPFDLIKER